jgi:hypothetical protein
MPVPKSVSPNSEKEIRKRLLLATFSFTAGIGAALVILHNSNVEIYGVSEFGVHLSTAPFLALGLFSAAYNTWKLADQVNPNIGTPNLGVLLKFVSLSMVLIVLTPFTIDTFFNWTHMIVGALLFLDQLYISLTLLHYESDNYKLTLLAVELIGGILAALSLPNHMLTYMFQGEIIFQAGFLALIFRGTHILASTSKRTSAKASHAQRHPFVR